jgi:outer membrane protein
LILVNFYDHQVLHPFGGDSFFTKELAKMSKFLKITLLAGVAQLSIGFSAMAADNVDMWSKDHFQVRGRILNVAPSEESSVSIGGKVAVSNSVTPEIDVTYFATSKIGLELIAATAQHKLEYTGNADLGDTWILPPTLTVQYHPLRGEGDFSPYVGVGLNYSMFYGEKNGRDFNSLDVKGGVGYAVQAGADYWLDDHWGLNLDVKKMWLDINANLKSGTTPIHADIDLDPWIVGAGVSYRF